MNIVGILTEGILNISADKDEASWVARRTCGCDGGGGRGGGGGGGGGCLVEEA